MAEKRKNLNREELRAFVEDELAIRQQQDQHEAERFAEAIIRRIATGNFEVRWDGALVVNFRLRSGYPSRQLLDAILADFGYISGSYDDMLRYFWTVDVKMQSSDAPTTPPAGSEREG